MRISSFTRICEVPIVPKVNIITSDRGWVLERLAREIATRIPYVDYKDVEDSNADIQYYITYSARKARISPIEIAFFTHIEEEKSARSAFFRVCKEVDHCVCMAKSYEKMIRRRGISSVSTIKPGVDLQQFDVKVRIGVVGRTYHTGRKGESLVTQVMDIPEIEWHFTGEGWPGPARNVPDTDLANFYRDMDYILVPSLYEGGPMCVVEALACGCEVVSSSVGWVDDFPHISFENGNADDLRRVLLELVEKKRRLRENVLDQTWDAWAEAHDRLFRELLVAHGHAVPIGGPVAAGPRASVDGGGVRRPALVVHGNEARSRGGPSVRVPRTAQQLRRQGLDAEVVWSDGADLKAHDLVHVFNVWNPDTALKLLHRANALEKPVVFSSIYLDLSERPYWREKLPAMFARATDPDSLEALLRDRALALRELRGAASPPSEPVPGYFAKVREMLGLCDHAIFLSRKEQDFLTQLGAAPKAATIVRNPVDADLYASGDPDLFAAAHGVRDYVLCVARIEQRKNQLMLVHALRNTGLPVVLLGHAADPDYAALLRATAGPNVVIVDRVSSGSDMLRSAYAGARVAALPSWAEGAPLSALEAAASGASLVLSDRSSEQEYFADYALFCDPADPQSIRDSVLAAYHRERTSDDVDRQKRFIRETYGWEDHTSATARAYQDAYRSFHDVRARSGAVVATTSSPARHAVPPSGTLRIVFDVTTSANHSGRWTGISRVEMAIARALRSRDDVCLRYVAWCNPTRRFIDVPPEVVDGDGLKSYLSHLGASAPSLGGQELAGATFFVAGSAWMQNTQYTAGVIAFARHHGMLLTLVLYDVIPAKFPFWFNEGYTPIFEKNLHQLLVAADRIVAISEATKRDVQDFYFERESKLLPISTFRVGDELDACMTSAGAGSSPDFDWLLDNGPGFVLSVGAVHVRKNHRLLYDVWIRLVEKLGRKAPRLLIVGGVAWNGHEVARAFREDRRLNGVVHILDDVSDTGLDWLYRNCLFTVYPSLYEGWGLPVAESLKYGKICIAANTSSVPEIAPQATDLLDPLDVSGWLSRVAMYVTSRAARAARELEIVTLYHSRSWGAAAGDLIESLRAQYEATEGKSAYRLGEVLHVGDPLVWSRYTSGAWHLPEHWGSWTAGVNAGLRLTLTEPPRGDLLLVADCTSIAAIDEPLHCTPRVNGVSIGHWAVSASRPAILCAHVPRNLVSDAGEVEIDFENSEITSIAAAKSHSKDRRRVGLGIAQMALIDIGAADPDLSIYFNETPRIQGMIRLGDRVDFVDEPVARRFLPRSAKVNEHWGAHTAGPLLTLSLPLLGMPRSPVCLTLLVRAVAVPKEEQAVTILANGRPVDAWQLTDDRIMARTVVLPAEAIRSGAPLRIDFLGATPRAPSALNLAPENDSFCLGILAFQLHADPGASVEPAPHYRIGEAVNFAKAMNSVAAPVLLDLAWYKAELGGRWSRGPSASFRFRTKVEPDEELVLLLEMRSLALVGGDSDRVTVELNGTTLGTIALWNVWTTEALPLPVDVLASDADNEIRLTAARGGSPFALGMGNDARDMGVMLRRMQIRSSGALAMAEATEDEPEKVIGGGEPTGGVAPLRDNIRLIRGGSEAANVRPSAVIDLPRQDAAPAIPPEFAERAYLEANPDVAEALAQGLFSSGFEHWLLHGREEGRRFA